MQVWNGYNAATSELKSPFDLTGNSIKAKK